MSPALYHLWSCCLLVLVLVLPDFIVQKGIKKNKNKSTETTLLNVYYGRVKFFNKIKSFWEVFQTGKCSFVYVDIGQQLAGLIYNNINKILYKTTREK